VLGVAWTDRGYNPISLGCDFFVVLPRLPGGVRCRSFNFGFGICQGF